MGGTILTSVWYFLSHEGSNCSHQLFKCWEFHGHFTRIGCKEKQTTASAVVVPNTRNEVFRANDGEFDIEVKQLAMG